MTFRVQDFAGRPKLSYRVGPVAGPPLLLLHGVGRSSEDYATLASELSLHWHVHALDLRGHGGSERAAGYLVTDYVQDVVDFVSRTFSKAPVTLVGHSLGAMVALGVAAALPANVQALVLEDPPFHTMGRDIAGTTWKALFTGMREVGRSDGTREERVEQLAAVPIHTGNVATARCLGELRPRPSLEASVRFLESVDPEVFSPVIEARWLEGYDHQDLFSRVRCPVLLLQGDAAAGAALTDADVLLALSCCPEAQTQKFPGIGHLIHGECPGRLLAVMEEFFQSCRADGVRPPRLSSQTLAPSAWAAQGSQNPSSTPRSDQNL